MTKKIIFLSLIILISIILIIFGILEFITIGGLSFFKKYKNCDYLTIFKFNQSLYESPDILKDNVTYNKIFDAFDTTGYSNLIALFSGKSNIKPFFQKDSNKERKRYSKTDVDNFKPINSSQIVISLHYSSINEIEIEKSVIKFDIIKFKLVESKEDISTIDVLIYESDIFDKNSNATVYLFSMNLFQAKAFDTINQINTENLNNNSNLLNASFLNKNIFGEI